MSHSRKKHPFRDMTNAASEKEDKKQWHRAFRWQNNMLAASGNPEEIRFPLPKEMSDPWQMAKDEKAFYTFPGADRN
jgi:hypothetical protein